MWVVVAVVFALALAERALFATASGLPAHSWFGLIAMVLAQLALSITVFWAARGPAAAEQI